MMKTLGRVTLRLLGGAIALGGVACAELPEQPVLHLADLKAATMQVAFIYEADFGVPSNRFGGRVEVTFLGAPTDCYTFASDVRATVAGYEMRRDPGEWTRESCGATSFRFQLSQAPELSGRGPSQDVVELSDGQDVFRATLQNLLVNHGPSRLEVLLPSSPLEAGETLVYDWQPGTDLFDDAPDASHATFRLFERESRLTRFQHTENPLTSDLKFEVPLPASLHTGEMIGLVDAASRIPVLSCEGPAACEAPARYRRAFRATVSAP
jgi:hypothetical protein